MPHGRILESSERSWLGAACCYGEALVLTVVLLCCDSNPPSSGTQTLRVGASWGLAALTPDSSPSGSSAEAQHLLFDVPRIHIAAATQNDRSVIFKPREDSSKTAAQLATSFRYEGLSDIRSNSDGTVTALFSSTQEAAQVATLDVGGFALGPFRLTDRSDRTATLRRRVSHPISHIEIKEVTAQDEWRLFLGHQLDVIPRTSILFRDRLTRIPSVKVVDYPPSHRMNLIFNTKAPLLSTPSLRRTIASLIDRKALAHALSRPEFALDGPRLNSPRQDSGTEQAAVSVELAYLAQDMVLSRTAQVIRFQLQEHGVEVRLRPVEIAELQRICHGGSFEMTLLPIPLGRRGDTRFLSSSHPASTNLTGYSNRDYDAAYNASDVAAMETHIQRDLPASQLYTEQYFAAVRSDLCLGESPKYGSWRWLAALHPCASETQP